MINIFVSVILGIILSLILYNKIINPTITKGPNSKNIVDKIFKVDDKYYKLEPKVCGKIIKI
jgi:hypothetical protein